MAQFLAFQAGAFLILGLNNAFDEGRPLFATIFFVASLALHGWSYLVRRP